MKKLNVAIIGQGRSGRDIHGQYLLSDSNTMYNVVAVVDELEHRRKRAEEEFHCKTFADFHELYSMKDEIDIVVNSTYSHFHYPVAKELLQNGFNVLVEKPFAATEEQCRELILLAKDKGVKLFVFQQTLLTPPFKNVKDIIASGKLGELVEIGLKYSGLGYRWDWQTLQATFGGSLYNTGPHPVGQALDLLGWDPDVKVEYSCFKTVNTKGDAEDFVKAILTAPNKPLVDIEISSSDPRGDYVFKIQGANGTLYSTNTEWEMTYIIPDEWETPDLIRESLQDENGHPMYCQDKHPRHTESGKIIGSSFDSAVRSFYEMMYKNLTEDIPGYVTPEMAAMVVRVIEQCHIQNPLPKKFEL